VQLISDDRPVCKITWWWWVGRNVSHNKGNWYIIYSIVYCKIQLCCLCIMHRAVNALLDTSLRGVSVTLCGQYSSACCHRCLHTSRAMLCRLHLLLLLSFNCPVEFGVGAWDTEGKKKCMQNCMGNLVERRKLKARKLDSLANLTALWDAQIVHRSVLGKLVNLFYYYYFPLLPLLEHRASV
jgi:hypothetical protein